MLHAFRIARAIMIATFKVITRELERFAGERRGERNGQQGGAVRQEGTAQRAGRGGDEHRVAGARRRNVAGGGPVRRREPFRLAHMLKSSLSSATVQYIGKYTDFSECVPARTSRS